MSKWFANITSLDELRNQYKKLLIKYHPDNNHNLDTTDVMQEINSEYDQLLNHFKDNHTNTQTETELKKTLNEVIKLHATNITIELVGTWIWISGKTYPIKDKLCELHFKFSSKRKMWYWGTRSPGYHVQMDMDSIRSKYGSVIYTTTNESALSVIFSGGL